MKNLFRKILGASAIAAASTPAVSEIVEYETKVEKTSEQPAIVIRISDKAIPEQDVKVILEGFEEQIASGVRFKDEETLQLGFMLNQFKKLDDGRLVLEEPDMFSFPINFIPSMNYTFKTLRNQKDVVESVGSNVELNFPNIRQAIAVHKDYKSSAAVMLERINPEDSQSGWWVHVQGDTSPENYSLTSLYQFALDRPDLVHYLALPVGAKAYDIKGSPIRIAINDREVTFQDGSYLSELNKKLKVKK